MMFKSPKSNNIPQDMLDEKPKKRKLKFSQNLPLAKRNKDKKEEVLSYAEQFKYVLAPPDSNDDDSDSEKVPTNQQSTSRVIKKATRPKPLPAVEGQERRPKTFILKQLPQKEEEEEEHQYDDSQSFSADDVSSDSDYQADNETGDNFSFETSNSTNDPDYEPEEVMNMSLEDEDDSSKALECDIEMSDESVQSLTDIWQDVRMEMVDKPTDYVQEVDVYEISEEEEGLEMEFSELVNRSTFINCFENGSIVKFNATIHFHGIIEIRPLINAVQINGFTIETGTSIQASSISRADYFLNMTPVYNGADYKIDIEKLIKEIEQLQPEIPDIKKFLMEFDLKKDILVHLRQSTPSSAIDMINRYATRRVLPTKPMLLRNCANPSSEHFLDTKFFVNEENPRLNCFLVNEDWNRIELKFDSKTVIVGGKNVGKSSLAQYTINRNIEKFKKILLIDLDIGQQICGIAQTVSATVLTKPLLGAGYLNEITPKKSMLYGDKSIMTIPHKYIECVKQLLMFCLENEEYSKMPWIVNMMGYQKGFGLELTSVLLRLIQPTDVVQIQHANQKYNYDAIVDEKLVNSINLSMFSEVDLEGISTEAYFTTHIVDSLVNNTTFKNRDGSDMKWISNATEKRKMSLLAQLSKLTKAGQPYLNDVTPKYSSFRQIRMVAMDQQFEISCGIADTSLFNGNIVYLCNCPNDSEMSPNSVFGCHGLGLVRALDNVQEQIYVLMPPNLENLSPEINTLTLGYLPVPNELIIKQNFGVTGNIPFITKQPNQAKYRNKRNIKDIC